MTNLKERKKNWVGDIDFPKTKNISSKRINANDIIIWNNNLLTKKYLRSIDEDQRDEIAKDIYNFFMEYDFIKDYRYTEDELQQSWKSIKNNKLSIETLSDGKYITNCGCSGYKIFHHFFPNIIKVRGEIRKSIYDVIIDKKLLWDTIRNRIGNTLLYGGEDNIDIGYCQFPMPITPSQILIGAKNSGLATQASIFKPNVAKAIYNTYVKDGDKVLDYSCGFGTRLLGLMATEKKDIKYYGYEPNKETYDNLYKMAKFFNFDIDIKCCGSEEALFDEKFDFIFSSPPYFTAERYSDDKNQCYNKYPIYEDWLEKYWRQTIKNIKIMIKEDGIFGINIGNKSNAFMIKIGDDMNKIIVEEGFILKDTLWMKTSRSHLSGKKGTKDNYKLEGIYFYGHK